MNLSRLKAFVGTATFRLTLSYLAIIMLMSISFSFVFFNTSAHEIDRQSPPPSVFGVQRFTDLSDRGMVLHRYIEERRSEGRSELLLRIVWINLLVLVAGSILGYYLARRTLDPIERNMDAQTQFVSDASHELRTPLTALQTTNEVALRRSKLSADEAKVILRDNIDEVAGLKALTDGLLELARQENEDVVLQSVPLQSVVTDAINRVLDAAVANKVTIDDSLLIPANVVADQIGLTQVLVILLDNAIKYSYQNTTIHLQSIRQGRQVHLKVQDEGIGIDADDLPYIFDRFFRADRSRQKLSVGGHGIGLALAKKIVSKYHGEISVTSQKGIGTTFIVKLALA